MSSKNLPRETFPDIFPPREIRVLGAGRFGRMAAERLKRRFPDALLSVTDKAAEKLDKIRIEVGVQTYVEDSVEAITKRGLPEDVWIIPAVPLHVGFEWLLVELNRTGGARMLSVPESAETFVPNPLRSPSGTLYASFATFICPDYCNEPDEICTTTGKARPGNLFEVFGNISIPGFGTVVLRSWQLAPGVGGYPVRGLNELLSTVAAEPGKYLIATSCRCHGVLDAMEWTARFRSK